VRKLSDSRAESRKASPKVTKPGHRFIPSNEVDEEEEIKRRRVARRSQEQGM
jgi:hypothetical protein